MKPKWHIAFCNVTYTEYGGVTYREYYSSPELMLKTQLAAKEYVEKRWGVGNFIQPGAEMAGGAFSSLFGMKVIDSVEDEIPYLDTTKPVITDVSNADRLVMGDLKTSGIMAKKYKFWKYYHEHGYPADFGGEDAGVISYAVELTGMSVMNGMADDPANARRVLDIVVEAAEKLATFGASLSGKQYTGFTYTGDDFSGLLSPTMYREFAAPCYRRLYAANTIRFMHSELLRAEHLIIARDEVGITEFHGAGCKNVTLQEMYSIMGQRFWAQLTPQEMLELTPHQIDERIKEFVDSGCGYVQLYPGRGTPERNMAAAIEACRREC
ncbi:MAG: hypothetical protein KJ964_01560, partial [Verrucomicrobia bacterium]|nr:hypothetical protein [Verrucomicrobiota bacterium]